MDAGDNVFAIAEAHCLRRRLALKVRAAIPITAPHGLAT